MRPFRFAAKVWTNRKDGSGKRYAVTAGQIIREHNVTLMKCFAVCEGEQKMVRMSIEQFNLLPTYWFTSGERAPDRKTVIDPFLPKPKAKA